MNRDIHFAPMQPLPSPETAQRVYFKFDWNQFEQFLKLRGEASLPRFTYLDGVLEVMAPSKSHEGIKSRLARLLELWAFHEGVELAAFGSTTLKRKKLKSGVEPDECYVVGRSELGPRPDLAIEVNLSSGGIDKLEAYHRLSVPEVWFWEDGKLVVFHYKASGYVKRSKSAVLPTLDLKFFVPFVADPDQLRALRTFRAALRHN